MTVEVELRSPVGGRYSLWHEHLATFHAVKTCQTEVGDLECTKAFSCSVAWGCFEPKNIFRFQITMSSVLLAEIARVKSGHIRCPWVKRAFVYQRQGRGKPCKLYCQPIAESLISWRVLRLGERFPEVEQIATIGPLKHQIVFILVMKCGQQLYDVRIFVVAESFQWSYFCSEFVFGTKPESFES